MFHVSSVRTAAYCGRQAYYEDRREACRVPSPETRVLRELAYIYPTVVDAPEDALRRACETAGVRRESIDVDMNAVAESLVEKRDGELWNAVARPDREERYVEADEVRGTLDKLSFGDEGIVVSKVKTGTPPDNGVWSSERAEAAALARLAEAEGGSCAYVVVEYPRVGALRRVEVGHDDERALRRILEKLEKVEDGVPPSRTDSRAKCKPCDFSDECGVETRSLLTRLRERFG